MYYGGWTYWDAYYLPVNARRWMLDRIVKEMKGKDGGDDNPDAPLTQSRAPIHNTEDVRSLQERTRINPPPRLIRFT